MQDFRILKKGICLIGRSQASKPDVLIPHKLSSVLTGMPGRNAMGLSRRH